MKRCGFYAGVVFCCLFCSLLNAQTEKLTAEEVVSRSLAAIASPQDRAAVKYFELTGIVKINTTGIGLDTDGTVLLTSEGDKVKVALKTPSKLYSADQFVFNGKNVTVTTDPRGRRSPLGDFMFWQGALLRDGLLGGVLSTAWPLYDPKLRKDAKLSYDGLKELDGTKVHVLTYTSKNVASTTNVKLLFDAATFRHIKTTCVLEVTAAAPRIGSGSVDANYRPAHYTLEETFSNFHQLGSYMLPLHEKLSLTTDAGTGNWYFDVNYNNLNGSDLSPILK
jgi:outer membrane lipoprotein-sorting protein